MKTRTLNVNSILNFLMETTIAMEKSEFNFVLFGQSGLGDCSPLPMEHVLPKFQKD